MSTRYEVESFEHGEWKTVVKFKDPQKAWEHKETLSGKVRLMRVFEKRTPINSVEEIAEWARSYGIKNRRRV